MVIVTPIQAKKKQRYLILILILAILGIVFVVWYRFLPKQSTTPRILPEKPAEININFGVLDNKILTKLYSFEPVPLFKSEDAGRSNPFQSY